MATPRLDIDALLRHWGLRAARVQCVSRLGIEVHRIRRAPGDRQGGDLALRIYPAQGHDEARVATEVAWLAALADQGLHVPRPLLDRAGRRWQVVRGTDGIPRVAVLLTWLGGRMHERGLTPQRLRRVGVLCARMHATGQQLAACGQIATQHVAFTPDLPGWARGAPVTAGRLPPRLRELLVQTATRLVQELAAFPRDASSWGLVHGDLHPWNLLFVRDVAGAFDFSDCGWGHPALDLAATLQYLRHPVAASHDHRRHYRALHDALLDGYASVRTLPGAVERQIEVYLVARQFITLQWMLEDWPSLDHRAWGPGYLRGLPRLLRSYLAG